MNGASPGTPGNLCFSGVVDMLIADLRNKQSAVLIQENVVRWENIAHLLNTVNPSSDYRQSTFLPYKTFCNGLWK